MSKLFLDVFKKILTSISFNLNNPIYNDLTSEEKKVISDFQYIFVNHKKILPRGKVCKWILSIDGNIAAGKSWLMIILNRDYKTFQEPVETWKELMKLMCKDKKRYAIVFQLRALIDQFKAVVYNKNCLIERSPSSDRDVFFEYLKKNGYISEESIYVYNQVWNLIGFIPQKTFLIMHNPDICLGQKEERNREHEEWINETILTDYQVLYKKLHGKYNSNTKWFDTTTKGTREQINKEITELIHDEFKSNNIVTN
jgi:deoxyadenosine/deoxycytidine kinase